MKQEDITTLVRTIVFALGCTFLGRHFGWEVGVGITLIGVAFLRT